MKVSGLIIFFSVSLFHSLSLAFLLSQLKKKEKLHFMHIYIPETRHINTQDTEDLETYRVVILESSAAIYRALK